MQKIEMTNLTAHYERIREEIDAAISEVIRSGNYINGPAVFDFASHLKEFTGASYVVPCANGTDALQIALMALNLQPGDEVIIPNFTFISAAEVIALLRLTPVPVDVDPDTFNINPEKLSGAISSKTRAIIPVHLFGQCCDMEPILKIAHNSGLYVIEDNAQSIGATYTFSDGHSMKAGTIGDIGTFSFFPSKNLGCFGDGGALITNNAFLAENLKMLTVHGSSQKYKHEVIGCNSRLDTLQAAILNVKIRHLEEDITARQQAAIMYSKALANVENLQVPVSLSASTHVFHQYTLKIKNGKRDLLQNILAENNIPSMIYYPFPIHRQPAFTGVIRLGSDLTESEKLCESVLSLPMHTCLDEEQIEFITDVCKNFLREK